MADTVKRVLISVRVQPRASRNEVTGQENGVWKIRIMAPPVEGKANKKLIEFMSERLGVSKSRIEIVKGETGRNKVVAIEGLERGEVSKRLQS